MREIFHRKFVAGQDPATGVFGWKPVDVRLFEPRDYRHPFGVAHDAMEHPERIDATLKNELQAQGAALYVRPSTKLPAQIAANIAYFYKQVHAGKFPDAPAGGGSFMYIDPDIRNYVSHIVSGIKAREPEFSIAEASTVVWWLAIGFEDAAVRYDGIERDVLTAMFDSVSRAVTEIGSNAVTGETLTVSVDYDHKRAYVDYNG